MSEELTIPVAEPLSETAYANRVLPTREAPFEVGATLLAAGAICLGLAALIFTPFKPGFAAIGLGILACCFAGERDRLPRIALTIATLGWLVGGILAVAFDQAVW
jgi:hypothetical protein